MKKMTKFMSLLLCVAMVLTMVACGNTQGTNPTTNGTVPTTKPAGTGESKGNYTVIVKTAGGMALANVDIEIRTGDDLVNVGRTNADGTYSIVEGLPIDEFSRGKIDASCQELLEERAEVLG